MRIAIASSGLGHVARGIETWAFSLAKALASEKAHRSDLDISLFHAAHPDHPILLSDAQQPHPTAAIGRRCRSDTKAVGLRCVKRGTRLNRWLTRLCAPVGGWRYGFGSDYQTEQTTFAFGLIRALREGPFDIVHLQDPWLAWCLETARRKGKHPAQVILAHGTEETPEYLQKYPFLQELTPVMAEQSHPLSAKGVRVWMIPNSVDTQRFAPAKSDAVGRALRSRLNLAPDTRIIGCVAALKAGHKRVDYLIEEFSRWSVTLPNPDHYALVLLGASTSETPALREQIERSPARARIRMLENVRYEEMPDYYAGFDLHALCSLFEVCPMAELEALASGVPCLGHDVAVNRWIIGDAGWLGDLSKPGGVGELLEAWRGGQSAESMGQRGEVERERDAGRGGRGEGERGGLGFGVQGSVQQRVPEERGIKARERAEQMFSPEAVIPQILRMYEEVVRC